MCRRPRFSFCTRAQRGTPRLVVAEEMQALLRAVLLSTSAAGALASKHAFSRVGGQTLRSTLLHELLEGQDPFLWANASDVDHSYPHQSLNHKFATALFAQFDVSRPFLYVEAGCLVGGSLIVVARALRALGAQNVTMLAIDPFTGDKGMWVLHLFLGLRRGRPSLIERFLANVQEAGFAQSVVPMQATASAGLKALSWLHEHGRPVPLANFIYLDSAHEQDETLLELRAAWAALAPGGILFGDDFGLVYRGVLHDVVTFAQLDAPANASAVAAARLSHIGEHYLGSPAPFKTFEGVAAVAQHIEACAKGMRCGSCMADVGGRNFLILAVQRSFKWVMVKD